MKKNHFQLFSHLRPAEPREDLLDRIMNRIDKEKKLVPTLRIKIRLAAAVAGACVSLAFIVPAWNSFQNDLVQSGFSQYVSLMFSDLNTVMNIWQDYVLSLIESIPLMSLTAILSIVFLLLFALKYLTRDLMTIISSHSPFLKI